MSLWKEFRTTERPGKRGGDFFYARIIHCHFDDIEKLKSEGFSLATICNFLEKKGVLPTNSDSHSFRRAFRREINRRDPVISAQSKNSRAAPQINPDNTFKITPVDPDDLPDIN